MSQPRIAFMTEQYDHVQSGPGTFTRYLRHAVADGRLDLTFYSDDIAAPAHPWERRVAPGVRLPSPPGAFVRQAAWHAAFVRDHAARPYDLLWYNTAVSGWVSSAAPRRVPLVLMANDYSNSMTSRLSEGWAAHGGYRLLTRAFWRIFEGSALRRAAWVVVNSRFLRDEMVRAYGLSPERVRVLYKAVDTRLFHPLQGSSGSALGRERVNVLFVKNNYVLAGLPELLHALAGARFRAALTVAGPPASEHARIRDLARRAGFQGALSLPGRVPREALPALFHAHDLFCVPSRAEALGVGFLESLACGIPAVGTSVGGIPEALDEGRAGWLARSGDPLHLRETLERVVEDADERGVRKAHGLRHVRAFSPERMVHALDEIARDAAGGAP